MTTDVLIVGAGPTALALAAQLTRYGIDFIILDKKESITPFSKAIGVQARTLEIYEQIDLAQNLLDLGTNAERLQLVTSGEIRGTIELANLGAGLTPYPFLLIVEQSKHEKLLQTYLESHGGAKIRWQTELENITQNAENVTATIKSANGERELINAKYLVGCDGAKSFVRHSLGLKFEGSTFERLFYVADVEINWNFAHDSVYVGLAEHTITAFFPMVGENRFRIVGTFPENHSRDENEISYEEIERQIRLDTEIKLDITSVNWSSVYKVHTRRVEKFSSGRCFLAGDAAHIHTPAGAQGMNTGIQDGYNLAWKLAMVLRGKAAEKLLETYNEERLPNAETLLKTTDRVFNFGVSGEKAVAYFRTHIFPYIANFALHIKPVQNFIFPRISQIGINYRESSLSFNDGSFKIKAGDRMPYFEIDGTSIYKHLREPAFHLLTFFDGTNKPADFKDLSSADLISVDEFPLYPNVADIFGTNRTFSILLRPDNYIGLITAENKAETIKNYLESYLH